VVVLVLMSVAVGCHGDKTPSDGTSSNQNAADPSGEAMVTLMPVDFVASKLGQQAELRCVPTQPVNEDLRWYRKGNSLTDQPDLTKYEFSRQNSSIVIKSIVDDDLGDYQCELGDDDLRANVTLYSVPFTREGRSINAYTGNTVSVLCRSKGWPQPLVSAWYQLDRLVVPDGVKFTVNNDTMQDGLLTVTELKGVEYGIYTCVTTNRFGSANSTTLVRVKSRTEVIWPILGIIIQLAILGIIIFFYERKKKKEMEVEKQREAEFKRSHPVETGRDDAVRQRKST